MCANRQTAFSPLPAFMTPPRVVAAFMVLSLAAWLLPLWGASLILLGALAAGTQLGIFARAGRGRLKTYVFFLCFWALSTFLLQWLAGGLSWRAAAHNAADLALRLTALAALTLDLGFLLTPFALAGVLARALKPVLGVERAASAGLALAVMLRLIPQAGHCLRTLRQTAKMRCRRLPRARQLSLMAGAALRHLSLLTWRQSLALAARNIRLARPDGNNQFQAPGEK